MARAVAAVGAEAAGRAEAAAASGAGGQASGGRGGLELECPAEVTGRPRVGRGGKPKVGRRTKIGGAKAVDAGAPMPS